PVSWAEVGVQVRGKYELNPTSKLNYAVFLVNGLQGDEGAGIRGARNNVRDKKDGDKAVGGRVGIDLAQGVELGVSGYSGIYTEDGEHRLTIVDADASFSHEGLLLRSEFMMAKQETSKDDLTKWGFYGQASYRFLDKYEPVVRYDQIELDGKEEDDRWRVTVGVNYYATDNLVAKVNLEHIDNGGDEDKDDDLIGVSLALGF
ncbi:MAG: porin, partial [Candidatus Poribacteria bacterium]|nr:porin [Candidatus Poribacteria bacterium]